MEAFANNPSDGNKKITNRNMIANVQSGHLVTGAEPYKPKATLWHKGSGSGKDIIR